MTAPTLEMQGVSFAYEKDSVLKNLSLAIHRGEFVGIIGPNGSGKSTLIKLLGGFLPAASGTVYFDSRNILNVPRKTLARSIAWVPQEHHLAFPFRVAELVMMGRHPYLSPIRYEGEEDHRIASQAMQLTATASFADRRFNEISGGEKQRVLMAGAICQEPEMMLLDEPTASLDIKYQMEILNILKRLSEQNNITQVMAIHDLHLASKFCQRLILLKEGQIVQDGSPEQVLTESHLEAVYETPVKVVRNQDDGSIYIFPGSPCTL